MDMQSTPREGPRPRPSRSRRARSWVGAIGVVLAAACARPGGRADLPMPSSPPGTAVMHAVRDDELRTVMARLEGGSPTRLPQELDDPELEREILRETGSRARELADAASRIGIIVGQIRLAPDEQQVFLEIATRLRDRALRLGEQAELGQTRLIGGTLRDIDETCTSCHELFRAPRSSPSDRP